MAKKTSKKVVKKTISKKKGIVTNFKFKEGQSFTLTFHSALSTDDELKNEVSATFKLKLEEIDSFDEEVISLSFLGIDPENNEKVISLTLESDF